MFFELKESHCCIIWGKKIFLEKVNCLKKFQFLGCFLEMEKIEKIRITQFFFEKIQL